MNYLKCYTSLIDHYKKVIIDGYYEKHHILPSCMGGTNDPENLLLLPTKAHFVAHHLLYKAYPENRKLAHAFAMMGLSNKHHNRKLTAKMYEKTKLARSKALKGMPRPEWVKELLRKPKGSTLNYHAPKTKEHANNISAALLGKKKNPESIAKSVLNKKLKRIEKEKKIKALFLESNLSISEFSELHKLSKRYFKKILS